MLESFLESMQIIRDGKTVPYYLESKIKDLAFLISISDKSAILNDIIWNKNSYLCFRYLHDNKILSNIFPYLESLQKVPQKKGKSRNALEHTLNVLDVIPDDNILLKWVAIFHDLGKYDSYFNDDSFNQHHIYSAKLCDFLCSTYQIQDKDKICRIVKNHMFPLDYQRNPNWTDKAIITFIERCGKENVIDIIEFSYYDKKAENDRKEYLDIIVELKEKVKKFL